MLRTGVAVMAAGLVLLTGCSSNDKPGDSAPGTSASSPAAAADANALATLNAAAQKTGWGGYHTDMTIKTDTTDMAVAASVDPQAKALEMSMDMQGTKITVRLVGTDMYFTGLSNTLQGKWVHADVSKLPGVAGILASLDQTFALMDGTVDLKEGPAGTFTGSMDPKAALAKAQTDAEKEALSKIVSAGSSQALPFTAKVADGYLVEMTTSYKMEQNGVTQEATIVWKFSQFGKVAAIVAPPKADTIDAS